MQTKVYAGRLKNKKALQKSSSGGAFTAISDIFLSNGDAVIASIYNYSEDRLNFTIIEDVNLRDQARGSKYFQSNVNNIFNESKTWLETHPEKKMLFVGTGCQAEAFRVFMDACSLSSRVFTVDIICYGVVSPEIWSHYLRYKLSNKGENPVYSGLTFKDKRNGWKHPAAFLQSEGQEISIEDYVKIFYGKAALRKSCYKCPYTVIERNTDITIGDFWGIDKCMPDFYDPMGNSLFLIHTKKGEALFNLITEVIDFRESNFEECFQSHLEHPTECPKDREKFWKTYHRGGIYAVMKKNTVTSAYSKACRKIKNMIKKFQNGEEFN